MRVGIIADDLTGAGDTAVQFVRAGWDAELQLEAGRSRSAVVTAITDSRGLTAAAAAAAVKTAVDQLRAAGVTHLYKKIDSTIRGQIRAEVNAALEAWGPNAVAVVCPAFPGTGRTVASGRLLVDGIAVTDTPVAKDPLTPVTESHIPTLIGGRHLRFPSNEPANSLAHRILANGRIVVMDASSDDDLARIAEAIAIIGPRAIAVGSAGLARQMAVSWKGDRAAIVIVTSLQTTTREQVKAVAAAGGALFEASVEDIVDDERWSAWSARVSEAFEKERSAIVLAATSDRSDRLPATLIPARFAELTARLVRSGGGGHASGIIVTGGDGARAVTRALGATGIRFRDEVIAGVPIGTLQGGDSEGLHIVTKAGGFGPPQTLVWAVEAVNQRKIA